MKQKILLLWLLALCLQSCESDLDLLEKVYQSDFEISPDERIEGALLSTFNGSQVLGPYNSGGFNLYLTGLPRHNHLLISFDLYIHDSWDGNLEGVGGPDLWSLSLNPFDPDDINTGEFLTSFSNTGCDEVRCLQQAYPQAFPFNNGPRTGAANTQLPGSCLLSTSAQGTSLYSIQKSFYHSGPDAVIRFEGRLKQTNTGDPKCDESWSLDNLTVWIANYK